MKPALLITSIVALGLLSVPSCGAQQQQPYNMQPPVPGALNYVEGAVTLNGASISNRQVGVSSLQAGDALSTGNGRAEVLLTPGIFLRLDHDTRVNMVSPDLTRTQVNVESGRIAIEVDQLFPQNDIVIGDNGVYTELVKAGLYEFTTNQPAVMVFDGKAAVQIGDGKYRTVKGHHMFTLEEQVDGRTLAKEKPVGFNVRDAEGQFYNWSSLRSEYLAQDNNQMAPYYAASAGFVPGWYWDPFAWDYTYIGLNPFYSPFGFGYYPFGWNNWYGAYPVYGGGWYGGRVYGGRHRFIEGHTPVSPRPGVRPLYGGGQVHSGFGGRGSVHAFSGGGFGGFHGVMGGGGFHGGMAGGGSHVGGGGRR
ncbi:MAG: hypothetical protein KGN79_16780 [Acidobacteriota bacterium]|nr:hypothetical protein [Acidobacteriota bacterium]